MADSGRFKGRPVVITGGSSGIGLAIAREFLSRGANLWLIARNQEKLEAAQSGLQEIAAANQWIRIKSVDVSDAEGIRAAIEEIGSETGIHTLINNAGISQCDQFENCSPESIRRVMEVNFFGAMEASKAAWPWMKKEEKPHLGFVSSVAGYTGIFGYASYSSSKFALTGFAEALRMEFAAIGGNVSVLFPPDTDTPMLHDDSRTKPPEVEALSKNAKLMSAEAVAQKYLKGIDKGRFEVVCNKESRAIQIVKGLAPRLYYRILDKIVEKDRRKRATQVQK